MDALSSNWRTELGAAERYENIQRLKKAIEIKGLSATGSSQKVAFAAESDAYNTSKSREDYDLACNAITATPSENPEEAIPLPGSPSISIGSYQNCYHIASGLISEVYRSDTFALKVITDTRNAEPHNPAREAKILKKLSHSSIIKINETFRDREGRFVLVFPFVPLTLAKTLGSGHISKNLTLTCFHDLFSALSYLHEQGIIHRDVKPSNILLKSSTGPAYLADFGTAWHPSLSLVDEPANHKVLEVGTTCYRAPETLFGNRKYDGSLDMWASGTMLAECLVQPPKFLFASGEAFEDGNQLGLVLSIFKTIGTPTKETWPEAINFTTPPFEWYQEFPGRSWEELLPGVDENGRDLVGKLVRYESGQRLTAHEALQHPFFGVKQEIASS